VIKTAVGLLILVVLIAGVVFFLRWRNPEAFSRLQTDVVNLVVSAPATPPPPGPSPLLKKLTAPAVNAAARRVENTSNALNPPSEPPVASPAATTPPPTPAPQMQPQTAALPNAVPVVQPDGTDNANSESAAAAQAATAGTPAGPASPAAWTPPATLPAQPNWTWTTTDGHVYKNVKVVKVDPQTVTILHENGGTNVPISTLSPDLQKQFNYDPIAAANWTVGKMVAGNLAVLKDGAEQPVDDPTLRTIKYFALYYCAGSIPNCEKFTPDLVKFYNGFKPSHPDFEVILISDDLDARTMLAYMKETAMPWPAVSYGQLTHPAPSAATGIQSYGSADLPDLVLVDATGKVLSESHRDGKYVGPGAVVDDIKTMVQ
jgi:hypothetical protein